MNTSPTHIAPFHTQIWSQPAYQDALIKQLITWAVSIDPPKTVVLVPLELRAGELQTDPAGVAGMAPSAAMRALENKVL